MRAFDKNSNSSWHQQKQRRRSLRAINKSLEANGCFIKHLRNSLTGQPTNEAYCKQRLNFMEKVKDKNFETSCSGSNKFSNYFGKEGALRNETRRAELMITAFLIDHNIIFMVLNHLLAIAREFACKRTCYNILGEEFKTELINDIAKTKDFSVIINESNDLSAIK